ncbi:Carnitine monooxygenase alpha subunit [Hyphodiscus hymeniophilus]|uniref:Carnitine monooxygenase alpha subunit n=1 Tax=Hyphodiscus hymeniophilus TaxID=353542 RepID=A0A9P6SJY1_9HELO|nr:Carnitine monooxygenase alpha subunit [Hyphodiscus hymeniophilus]
MRSNFSLNGVQFSSWLFVTHASRFQKPGDYRTFETAGFSFIVILGKDKQLRAFHNVCRHRAYAVTKKESGSSTVLGCRYHGWSYDTKGKLIKAPEFENVVDFDKSLNGLWELKTKEQQGMLFVNFQVEESNHGLEMGESGDIIKSWKIGDMKWAHEWRADGSFNWKLAERSLLTESIENFFCDVPSQEDTWMSTLRSFFSTQHQRLFLAHDTILRQLPSGHVLTLRALPSSPNKTLMECNIYGRLLRHTKTTQIELETVKREVESEIKRLELQHEALATGNSHVQSPNQVKLSEVLSQHTKAEKAAKKEIHPAARKQSFTNEGMADDDCKHPSSSIHCSAAIY